MTSAEMERAIEFLLQSQANYETRQVRLESQMEVMIQIHTEFAQFTRANIEALNEHSQSIRETVRAMTIRQAQSEQRLDDLERQGGNS